MRLLFSGRATFPSRDLYLPFSIFAHGLHAAFKRNVFVRVALILAIVLPTVEDPANVEVLEKNAATLKVAWRNWNLDQNTHKIAEIKLADSSSLVFNPLLRPRWCCLQRPNEVCFWECHCRNSRKSLLCYSIRYESCKSVKTSEDQQEVAQSPK